MSCSLASLVLDLFLLGHSHVAEGEAGKGLEFERRVRAHMTRVGLLNASGFTVFGRKSISGLYHQLDEQTACTNALVVGEWKAYRGKIPKNELLRFKSVTDDYWLGANGRINTSIMRVFGGTGRVSEAMTVFAAQWGIVLVTPDTWPIPALCDPDLLWSPGDLIGPTPAELRTLSSLAKPLNSIIARQHDGSWRMPPVLSGDDLIPRIRLWQAWSDRAWDWWHGQSGARFENLVEQRLFSPGLAA